MSPNTTPNFWHWLAHRDKRYAPGWTRVVNWHAIIHILIGAGLGVFVRKDIEAAAATVLLPLAGVFVGLAFAWGGNAQSLLQSDEIARLAKGTRGGLRDYVFTYQLAVLMLMATLSLWGVAGLGIFEVLLQRNHHPDLYRMVAALLYAASSASLRECWHVVTFSQATLLARADIREALEEADAKSHTP